MIYEKIEQAQSARYSYKKHKNMQPPQEIYPTNKYSQTTAIKAHH